MKNMCTQDLGLSLGNYTFARLYSKSTLLILLYGIWKIVFNALLCNGSYFLRFITCIFAVLILLS